MTGCLTIFLALPDTTSLLCYKGKQNKLNMSSSRRASKKHDVFVMPLYWIAMSSSYLLYMSVDVNVTNDNMVMIITACIHQNV